jgi:hypothetical protein
LIEISSVDIADDGKVILLEDLVLLHPILDFTIENQDQSGTSSSQDIGTSTLKESRSS